MLARILPALLVLSAVGAGCLSNAPTQSLEPGTSTLDPAMNLTPKTEVLTGSVMFSAATPIRTINNGGAFVNTVTVSGNTTGFVFEVVWSPASPASQQLSLWVRPTGVGSIPPNNPQEFIMAPEPTAKATGASPLRIAMAKDAFPAEGDYDVIVRAAAEPIGIAVNQPYDLHLTTFKDLPFDDAFSALGEDHEH